MRFAALTWNLLEKDREESGVESLDNTVISNDLGESCNQA